MNSSVISLNRLVSLLKLTLHLNLKRMLYTACIGLVVAIIYLFIFWSSGEIRRSMYFNQHEFLFVLSLFISGFIFSASSFVRFRSKQGTIDYLMLPASNTEKFICEVLLTTLVYPLLFLLCYWLFSLVSNFILNDVYQVFFMPFSLNICTLWSELNGVLICSIHLSFWCS